MLQPFLKRNTKAIAGKLLMRSGLLTPMLGERAVILGFHRVNDDYTDELTYGVEAFRRVCTLAKEHFRVVPLQEIVMRLERGRPVKGLLAITFDDGYLDNYQYAAPILEELGLPATFFVVSRFIETEHLAWWDKKLHTPPKWMSWDQVRDLNRRGFSIGAHTSTHVNLGEVRGEEAKREITLCRDELMARVPCNVEMFAYPYGQPNNLLEENRELIRQAGYRCCVSCYGGTVAPDNDPLRLQRVPISNWFSSAEQFALEVALGRA
jgi:peptidoglycan/xylan/chitin deacetylase (PgdA/CDA1 family)